jgi:hypothetical protein
MRSAGADAFRVFRGGEGSERFFFSWGDMEFKVRWDELGQSSSCRVLSVGMEFASVLSVVALFFETSSFMGQSVVRILTQDC